MIKQRIKAPALLLGLVLVGSPLQAQGQDAEDPRAATKEAAAEVLKPLLAEILNELETPRLVAELAGDPEDRVLVATATSNPSEEVR